MSHDRDLDEVFSTLSPPPGGLAALRGRLAPRPRPRWPVALGIASLIAGIAWALWRAPAAPPAVVLSSPWERPASVVELLPGSAPAVLQRVAVDDERVVLYRFASLARDE